MESGDFCCWNLDVAFWFSIWRVSFSIWIFGGLGRDWEWCEIQMETTYLKSFWNPAQYHFRYRQKPINNKIIIYIYIHISYHSQYQLMQDFGHQQVFCQSWNLVNREKLGHSFMLYFVPWCFGSTTHPATVDKQSIHLYEGANTDLHELHWHPGWGVYPTDVH